jgi:hypothetical protein
MCYRNFIAVMELERENEQSNRMRLNSTLWGYQMLIDLRVAQASSHAP